MKSPDALKGGGVDTTRGLLKIDPAKADQTVTPGKLDLDQLPDSGRRQFEGTGAPTVQEQQQELKQDRSFVGGSRKKRAGRTRAWKIAKPADHVAVLRRPMVRQAYREIVGEETLAVINAATAKNEDA